MVNGAASIDPEQFSPGRCGSCPFRTLPGGTDLARDMRHAVMDALRLSVHALLRFLHNPGAFHQRNLEFIQRSSRRPALEDIVRNHADGNQLIQKEGQRPWLVIDPPQQDCLIPDDAAAADQRIHSPLRLVGNLMGMIEVGHDQDLLLLIIFLQNGKKLRILIDPHRKYHRSPCSDPDKVQRRDSRERFQVHFDILIRIHQRISAGQENIIDLRMLCHILCHLLNMLRGFMLRVSHHPLAEAESAVHRALIRSQDQCRLAVLVLHAADHGIIRLPARIFHAASGQLLHAGYADSANRIERILLIDQPQIVGRDAERIPFGDLPDLCHLFRTQIQIIGQLLHVSDAL